MKMRISKLLVPTPLVVGIFGMVLAQTDDPVIQERLAKHANLFAVGRPNWSRLEDLKPKSQGVVVYEPAITRDNMLHEPPHSPAEELAYFGARTDAVISGTTLKQYSAANSLHTFLYSDWIISVTKIYKNTSTVPAQIGGQITVTRRGGDLVLNGIRVIARDRTFPDFAINHQYVFYLKALPETSSFQAISGATFDVTGTVPLLLLDPHDPTSMRGFVSATKADFFAAVERSTTR
jgi:hypothetical protein